jgi:hypothetical protein
MSRVRAPTSAVLMALAGCLGLAVMARACKPISGLPSGSGGAAASGGGPGTGGRGSGGRVSPVDAAPSQDALVMGRDGGPADGVGMCFGLGCKATTCNGECTVPPCAAGVETTASGTVFDPAGKVPLYNVVLYVPGFPAEVAPIEDGATCEKCATSASGRPVAATLTDTKGQFRLLNVPVGTDIPLVIQIGKWRRIVKLPPITACADNTIPVDLTRLPRNQSEGHIPKIALTTGGLDALECLLRKIGIDDSEFTPESDLGRVNLYAGLSGGGRSPTNRYQTLNGGAMFTPANPWWESAENLLRYDLVLHSCDGIENGASGKSVAARAALQAYADAGGRVFVSHWHNYWVEQGAAPWPTVATFNHLDDPEGDQPFIAKIDVSFPKGMALSEWLFNVGGSTTAGQLGIRAPKHTVDAVNPTLAQRWIYSDADPAAMDMTLRSPSVQYLTFNTPLDMPADKQCGRVVLSDLHVNGVNVGGMGMPMPMPGVIIDESRSTLPFPSGCRTTELSPQEKALEFMLFDLSSCVQPDYIPPMPPGVM